MARRKAADNGSTAALDPPESEEQTAGEEPIPANLQPEGGESSGE